MGKLVCPLCGDATSANPLMFDAKVRVGKGGNTWAIEEGQAIGVTPEVVGEPTYGIMECQSCERRFVAEQKYDGWVAVYPIRRERVDKDIPEPMRAEFEEAGVCFAVGAYRGCASMCETAIEALWREQGASGLKELKEKGVISEGTYKRANEVRLWANVAKHELIPDVVEEEDAEQLLTYVGIIMNAVYVEPKRLSKLSERRKQLEKKE